MTALATGLGALPLAFRRLSRRWVGIGNALASGLMLAASAGLLLEGWPVGRAETIGGALLGGLFIIVSRALLETGREPHVGRLRGADARRAILLVGAMTVHSAAEGIGVGVSFGGGADLGVFISLAIAVHNIPEGLAISLVLVPRGVPVWSAAGWSVFSSLPQPLLAVPAFLFVLQFAPLLPWGLGFAAGAMIWMVAIELIPEAAEDLESRTAIAGITILSALAMASLQWMLRI